jgi:hypothetical protein
MKPTPRDDARKTDNALDANYSCNVGGAIANLIPAHPWLGLSLAFASHRRLVAKKLIPKDAERRTSKQIEVLVSERARSGKPNSQNFTDKPPDPLINLP